MRLGLEATRGIEVGEHTWNYAAITFVSTAVTTYTFHQQLTLACQ